MKVAHSPLTHLLPDHATPELRRLQAELGARHSFREAARLLNELTPYATQNHVTIRNRLATIADDLTNDDHSKTDEAEERLKSSDVTVFLDSAYVRSRPVYQRRNFEIIVGSIESKRREKRRFGLSVIGANNPCEYLRRNLEAAGWRDGTAVTVLSDGNPALPRLVRGATGRRSITSWTGGIFQYASNMWKRHSKPCFLFWKPPRVSGSGRWYNTCAGAYGMAKRLVRLMPLKRCSDLACTCDAKLLAERTTQRFRQPRTQWNCRPTWNTIARRSSTTAIDVEPARPSRHRGLRV